MGGRGEREREGGGERGREGEREREGGRERGKGADRKNKKHMNTKQKSTNSTFKSSGCWFLKLLYNWRARHYQGCTNSSWCGIYICMEVRMP